MRFPAHDLRPHDSYIHTDADGLPHVVTIVSRLAPIPDSVGLPTLAFTATADGRLGLVFLRDTTSVDLML